MLYVWIKIGMITIVVHIFQFISFSFHRYLLPFQRSFFLPKRWVSIPTHFPFFTNLSGQDNSFIQGNSNDYFIILINTSLSFDPFMKSPLFS